MSFDWKAFATGFMERTSEIRDTRQEEAKTYEAEQRRAAERNAQVISRRRAIADRVTGYANYLQSNGVTDEQLQAAISSGPQAIESLTKRVQQAVQANRGRPLGTSDVDTLINLPEGFTPLDMTAQEFIDQTYGLSVPSSVREEQDFSFLDRLGGRNEMSLARDRLNRTPIIEGMTIEEVNRAAMQGDYQSLIPGTFASIVGPSDNPYSPSQRADVSADFTNTLDRLLSNVRSSDEWDLTSGLPEEEKAAVRQALLRDTADSFIRNSVGQYGMEFLRDQERFLELQLGEDYVEGLTADLTRPEDPSTVPTALTPEAQQTETVLTPNAQAFLESEEATIAEQEGDTPPVATAVTIPEVTTTVLPPAEDVQEPAPAEEQQDPVYTSLSDQGVDDISIALLRSHGTDMLDYVQSLGAKSNEELTIALSQWGQENSIVMPFDKSAIIYALNLVLDEQ